MTRPTLRDRLVEMVELYFVVGLMVRGGFCQLGYYWIVGKEPECEITRELTTDVPVVLEDIKPWAVYVVHLFPLIFTGWVGIVLWLSYPVIFTGAESLLEVVSLTVVTSQLAFAILWDPLVLLVHGPAERVESAQESEGPVEEVVHL